ncbi:MAG: UDP-N-acetylmuramate:L-alanyl-gamma-D-glutamyl-meso-diaminopimelate ligase [Deltaproteobacteria bacterium]|nr:UDP-N-acetylmuramate:L-alanyl-gamma-D-glutamyl-meso-diaminopimelate ligase [Deltaproteobacteria bacterium]
MKMKKIHFVGIGGVGMGTLARALADQGWQVTGSDSSLYEPMKSVLSKANIELIQGFDGGTASRLHPDVVVIGNVIRKDNPEAQAWLQSGTTFLSFPDAVRRFVIDEKKSIVVAGTHGKTTTTSWLAYALSSFGLAPSYLIGGVPRDLAQGCQLGEGELFVGEGDEYDSAFFDKGPKFLHYNPNFLILTSVEFDHADIYRDLNHVRSSFQKLISLLPGDGLCVARFEDPVVMGLAGGALCPIQTFGATNGAMWRVGKIEEDLNGFTFEIIYKGRTLGMFKSPLLGEHNLMNIISGIACMVNLGISMEKIRPVVETFHGVKRRQEMLATEPITLIDDFAHHPTEVNATLKAARRRFAGSRIWAIFEPRSSTARRNVHQQEYVQAFDSADYILVAAPYKQEELNESERFSAQQLVSDLKAKNKEAFTFPSVKEIVDLFCGRYQKGDTVVVMSNGEFDKIQEKILSAL